MTLKAKLTVSLAAIIVIAAAVLGVVAVTAVRSSIMTQVDERLWEVANRPSLRPPARPPAPEQGSGQQPQQEPKQEPPLAQPPEEPPQEQRQEQRQEIQQDLGPSDAPSSPSDDDTFYRRFAEILYEQDGTLVIGQASGFADEPDSLPDVDPSLFPALLEKPATVDATDQGRGGPFRAVAVERNGRIQVVAESIGDEQATITQIARLAMLSGFLVVAAAAVLSWLVIRRELRPVDRMVATAGAIAGGDLSQRIDHDEADTELGRLARSLDEMMAQLEAAFAAREAGEERVRRFAADASHELRTPLTAIRGYAELYRSGGIPVGDPLDSAFQRIESESTRMTRLVEDLLLLARLDQQQPLDRAEVDLAALVNEAAADLQASAPDRPITATVGGPTIVLGDERRLRQVVANLGGNALTHTPAGSAIRLTVSTTTDEAIIDIADDGPGISADLAARIFDRFYRVDKSRPDANSTAGSGLGLSIVSGLVEAHGGHVELLDTVVGATFRVHLPLSGRAPAT